MLIAYVSSDDEIILREMWMYDIHTSYKYIHIYLYAHTCIKLDSLLMISQVALTVKGSSTILE